MYIDFILEKISNRTKLLELETLLKKLTTLKDNLQSNKIFLNKYEGIKYQIYSYLNKGSKNDIIEVERKVQNFCTSIKGFDLKLMELDKIEDIPTKELENEIKTFIQNSYKNLKIDDINIALGTCGSLIDKVELERIRIKSDKEREKQEKERLEKERLERLERERVERERLERERLEREKQEKKELYIKIAKYVGIGIAILFALWLLLAVIIPFIVEFWWLLLLIGGVIAYFKFKK